MKKAADKSLAWLVILCMLASMFFIVAFAPEGQEDPEEAKETEELNPVGHCPVCEPEECDGHIDDFGISVLNSGIPAPGGEEGAEDTAGNEENQTYLAEIEALASAGTGIDMSDANPPAAGTGWTYESATGVYTILHNADVTVTGSNGGSQRRIIVNNGAVVAITLNNAYIVLSEDFAPLWLNAGANVTITLMGDNTIASPANLYSAGIYAPAGTSLQISGDGKLTAKSGCGAAIGGGGPEAGQVTGGGNITITGGTIEADSGFNSAAIGGGWRGTGGTINIGGTAVVTAIGSNNGAAIGGGGDSAGGNITIGGSAAVTAKNALNGAAIGGGNGGDGGTITITGGTVIAEGGTNSAAIGGGYSSAGGNITISGGNVDATGGNAGAGIGGGYNGGGGTINISGTAIVKAKSEEFGAAIGGGSGGDGGSITIGGTASVEATGGIGGAGIGGGDQKSGGTITISGSAVVRATGGAGSDEFGGAAGIGGGNCGAGGKITISGTG